MKYMELMTTVLTSDAWEWNSISGWVNPQRLGEESSADSGARITISEHHSRWVYQPDVQIAIAFGLVEDEKLKFDWHLPDNDVDGVAADILYNGQPIYREHLISVDGARAVLPRPEAIPAGYEGLTPVGIAGYQATSQEIALARLVDQLLGHREFDRYMKSTGITSGDD